MLYTNPPTQIQLHEHSDTIKVDKDITFYKDLPQLDSLTKIGVQYKRKRLTEPNHIKIEKVTIKSSDDKITFKFCGNRPHTLSNEKWEELNTSRC